MLYNNGIAEELGVIRDVLGYPIGCGRRDGAKQKDGAVIFTDEIN
jgi:hypothetical protein